jgi:hypothetical protein
MQTKTEAIQNHEDEHFRNSGQGEAWYGTYKYLKFEDSKLKVTMNKLPLELKHINILLNIIWSEDGRVSVDRLELLTKNRDVLASKMILDGYSCSGRKWDLNMVMIADRGSRSRWIDYWPTDATWLELGFVLQRVNAPIPCHVEWVSESVFCEWALRRKSRTKSDTATTLKLIPLSWLFSVYTDKQVV